jgi:ABC-type glycerol-3-phosphate transport system substrate-binding protein
MDFWQLGKNGLLSDMEGWLENDEELTDDIVFRDILLSGKSQNGIFAIPIEFTFTRLMATTSEEPLFENRQMMWDERMTWQEFFEKVSEYGYMREIAVAEPDLEIFMDRFISRASYFIDETEKTQNLNSEEMISLLEECREWRDLGFCWDFRNPIAEDESISYATTVDSRRCSEMLCTLPEIYEPTYRFFAPRPFDGDPVRVDGHDRYPETYYFAPLFGVNAGGPNVETAQDFLRFLLTEEAQNSILKSNLDILFPINRAVFRSMVMSDLEFVQGMLSTVELDYPSLLKEAEDIVDDIAYCIIPKPYYRTIIRAVARDFFLDQITAEETARQMSDKVGLYLKEQG